MQELKTKFCPSDQYQKVAKVIGRAFVASHNFAGIDEERYSPEKILGYLKLGVPVAAYRKNIIVGGICIFNPNPESACSLFREIHQIGLLGVEPELSGQSVGSMLMDTAETAIGIMGSTAVVLSVTTRAADLIQFYKNRGYVEKTQFHWEGVRDPSSIMVKNLSS